MPIHMRMSRYRVCLRKLDAFSMNLVIDGNDSGLGNIHTIVGITKISRIMTATIANTTSTAGYIAALLIF